MRIVLQTGERPRGRAPGPVGNGASDRRGVLDVQVFQFHLCVRRGRVTAVTGSGGELLIVARLEVETRSRNGERASDTATGVGGGGVVRVPRDGATDPDVAGRADNLDH